MDTGLPWLDPFSQISIAGKASKSTSFPSVAPSTPTEDSKSTFKQYFGQLSEKLINSNEFIFNIQYLHLKKIMKVTNFQLLLHIFSSSQNFIEK